MQTLKNFIRHKNVYWFQRNINFLYRDNDNFKPITIDMMYGNNSEKMCKQFQKDANIQIDGICGEKTWQAIFNSVKNIQQEIVRKGINITVDGYAGNNTEQAFKKLHKKTIAIDAGHYAGYNTYHGIIANEGDTMLKLAYMVKEKLKDNYNVILTREDDNDVSLTKRTKIAIKNNASLSISLHSNAGGGRGAECYYSVDLEKEREVAKVFADAVSAVIRSNSRGAKKKLSYKYKDEDYFTFIDNIQDAGLKNVYLLEVGFHDNIVEANHIVNKLDEIADKVAIIIKNVVN